MSDIEKMTWYGKKLDELTRKDLIEVVKYLFEEAKEMKPKADWYDENKLLLIEKGLIK